MSRVRVSAKPKKQDDGGWGRWLLLLIVVVGLLLVGAHAFSTWGD